MTVKHTWLFKSEPTEYSISDLRRDGSTCWDGVRNYQARNMLRDDVQKGDSVLFYHSGSDSPGIVGVASVTRAGYADHTQFDEAHAHYDASSTHTSPRWFMVDIAFDQEFSGPLLLSELKSVPALAGMGLLRKGNRLSIQPVTEAERGVILDMAAGRVNGNR